MTVVFNGDFETGNSSQYGAAGGGLTTPDHGTVSIVTSQVLNGVTVTPAAGATTNAMLYVVQNAGASGSEGSHAEAAMLFDWAGYYEQTYFYSLAFYLDPACSWTVGGGAGVFGSTGTNRDHLTLCQWLGRNLNGTSLALAVRPPGWMGTTGLSLTLQGSGGLTSSPSATIEHVLYVDTNWTTIMTPGTTMDPQRWPQLIGANCQQGQNITLTAGDWWEVIVEIKQTTDHATGYRKAYVRKLGSGLDWQMTLDDSAQSWKTVQYNASAGQPISTSGTNQRHSCGLYTYNTQNQERLLVDQFSIHTTLAEAKAKFATETTGGQTVRGFSTSGPDKLTISPGAAADSGYGTYLGVLKRTDDTQFEAWLTSLKASGTALNFYSRWNATSPVNILRLTVNDGTDFTYSGFTFTASDDWAIVAWSKANGTTTPRLHKCVLSGPTWAHQDADVGGTVANAAGDGTGWQIGNDNAGNVWIGQIAAVAYWNARVLADAELETIDGLQAIYDLTPTELWILNQASTGTSVTGFMGTGANQSALVGTTVVTTSMPNFDMTTPVTSGGGGGGGGFGPGPTGAGRVTTIARHTGSGRGTGSRRTGGSGSVL